MFSNDLIRLGTRLRRCTQRIPVRLKDKLFSVTATWQRVQSMIAQIALHLSNRSSLRPTREHIRLSEMLHPATSTSKPLSPSPPRHRLSEIEMIGPEPVHDERYWVTMDMETELRGTCHFACVNDVIFPADCSDLFITCSIADIRVWNATLRQELLRIQV